jgi:hypothetical protein
MGGRPLWREGGSVVCQSVPCRKSSQYVQTFYMFDMLTIRYSIYKASVSPGPVQQIMPYFQYFRYHVSLRHLNGRMLDRRQVWASYICCGWLRLVLGCEHFHCNDFEWLLLVACIVSLCNHIHMECEKLSANREPVCASDSCRLCGALCYTLLQFSLNL